MIISRSALRSIAAALGLITVTADSPPPEAVKTPEGAPPPPALTQPTPAPDLSPASLSPSLPLPQKSALKRLQKTSPHTNPGDMLRAHQQTLAVRYTQRDKSQDINPSQLAVLIDIAARTGRTPGELMATGELEGAGTWNNYVRPALQTGGIGDAQGVWQFMPSTFASVVRMYGNKMLKIAAADPATGRPGLDLGDENFTDAEVRRILAANTGNPKAGGDDLAALRSNFLVATLAKICLDDEAPDQTPEGRYAYHFLPAPLAKAALTNGRDPERRNTFSVKLAPPPDAALPTPSSSAPLPAIDLQGQPGEISAPPPPPKGSRPVKPPLPDRTEGKRRAPETKRPPASIRQAEGAGNPSAPKTLSQTPPSPPGGDGLYQTGSPDALPPSAAPVLPPPPPPPAKDRFGLDPKSATVKNNNLMFYPKNIETPYTWGQFLDNIKRLIKAETSFTLVRAKYGVGFPMKQGDAPEWSLTTAPSKKSGPALVTLSSDTGTPVPVPKTLAYGTLKPEEQERYLTRLAEMVQTGQDQPRATLSSEESAWLTASLKRQGVLPKAVNPATPVSDPAMVSAMRAFRQKVGMAEPDNPAHAAMLTPALQAALEIYDARAVRYAHLQEKQAATLAHGLDLKKLKADPAARQAASGAIIALKEGMKEAGLLSQPVQTVTETKTNKKGKPYKVHTKVPQPFDDSVPKDMAAKLDAFQLRNGLKPTHGVIDHATLEVLGVTPPPVAPVMAPAVGPGPLPVSAPPSSQFNPMAEPEPVVQVALPSLPALASSAPAPQAERSEDARITNRRPTLRPPTVG